MRVKICISAVLILGFVSQICAADSFFSNSFKLIEGESSSTAFTKIDVQKVKIPEDSISATVLTNVENIPNYETTQNEDGTVVVLNEEEQDQELLSAEAGVIGKALPYPNPMRFNQDGGIIWYQLTKDMDIELRVYNIRAQEIYKQNFDSGSNGGKGGSNNYNEVTFDTVEVGAELPCGVYIFILINNNKVLAKGKVLIVG